ncbi:hypothetical protein TrLO_g10889 [Triparma laevis f. longispina]|uniref:MYND-type domain-containing protein n=1 Tax=Triparma laevis f. longispina TaxID=1714387 RepID=A0A9W7C6X5_9STRA|nr:hypothetical protein TrLO_g10889 [Triparma laevis f. longispina]
MHTKKPREVMAKKKTLNAVELEEYKKRYDKVLNKTQSHQAALGAVARQMNPNGDVVEMDENFMKALSEMSGNLTTGAKGEELGDTMVCAWCRKAAVGGAPLQKCGRCRKVFYCNKECQTKAWKGHKKVCQPVVLPKNKKKRLGLNWEQLDKYGRAPATGKFIELKVTQDESMSRQVMGCRDGDGIIKRITCYNNSRSLAGFSIGKTFKWEHPIYQQFMDGSSGGRVEQEDVQNINIS